MLKMPPVTRSHLLIIGYGNTLRGDDGVGPRVAEAISSLALKGVLALACPQLSPEHADLIACAEAVVFVDGSIDGSREVRLQPVRPAKTSQVMAHAANPRTMLALARDVFGHAPKAWLLTIPMSNSGFTESLSPVAEIGRQRAISEIRRLHQEGNYLSSEN